MALDDFGLTLPDPPNRRERMSATLERVAAKFERTTEEQMTAYVKKRFGADFYALKRNGLRRICRTIGPLSIDIVGSARTWHDALAQANERMRLNA